MESRYIRVEIDTFDTKFCRKMQDFIINNAKDWNIDFLIDAFKIGFGNHIISDFVPVNEIETPIFTMHTDCYFNTNLIAVLNWKGFIYFDYMDTYMPISMKMEKKLIKDPPTTKEGVVPHITPLGLDIDDFLL